MTHIFTFIYRQKKVLLSIALIGFFIMLGLAAAWINKPDAGIFEPTIVFLGFIVTILQHLPTAILNAFPSAKYNISAEVCYGGFITFSEQTFWVFNKENDFKNDSVKSIQPFIGIKNNGDESIRIKGMKLDLHDSKEKPEKDSDKITAVEKGDSSEVEIGDSTHLPLLPFKRSLTNKDRIKIIMHDGCEIKLPKEVVTAILEIQEEANEEFKWD